MLAWIIGLALVAAALFLIYKAFTSNNDPSEETVGEENEETDEGENEEYIETHSTIDESDEGFKDIDPTRLDEGMIEPKEEDVPKVETTEVETTEVETTEASPGGALSSTTPYEEDLMVESTEATTPYEEVLNETPIVDLTDEKATVPKGLYPSLEMQKVETPSEEF